MTADEKRAYSRGYNAGSRGKWPEHAPPNPPQEHVLALFVAAKSLADAAAAVLQVVLPDDGPDGLFTQMQQEVNRVDAAFETISRWLRQP